MLLFSVIFFFSQLVFSQTDKSDYQLLWEISGNGLEKPSYLFGTIHLRDKRAFAFSDSLLYKLAECEAFATEVHPDSAFLFYTTLAFSRDTTDYLREMMSSKAYERLKNQLRNREGIYLDSIQSKNPFYVESLFDRSPESKPDDKDLFVDLYLYRMARRSGKLTYGLEKVQDHKRMNELFFTRFEEEDYPDAFEEKDFDWKSFHTNRVKTVLDIYETGSLDAIEAFLKIRSDSAYNEASLTKRNVIMADNIKKIIHDHSLFAAMGAAHLPGEGGVIKLLEQAGYNMRPVTATFTGKADEFKLQEKEAIWQNYKEDYHRFEVDLPGEPYIWQYEKKGLQLLFHYMLYDDRAEDNDYAIKVSTDFKEEDEPLDSFLLKIVGATFLPNKNIADIQYQVVEQNGMEGLEFRAQVDSIRHLRGRVFYNGTATYQAIVRRDDTNLDHRDIDRFFNSLVIAKPKIYEWKRFTSEQGAFSVSTPFEPDESVMDVPVPDEAGNMVNLNLHFFNVKDLGNGMLYLMRYNGMGEGRYIENDTFFFDTTIEDFKQRSKLGEPDTIFTIYRDGYEGREVLFKNDVSNMRIQLFLRGSRMYLIIAASLAGEEKPELIDDFFNSFRFQDFNHSELSEQKITEHGLSVDLPKPPTIILDTFSVYDYPFVTSSTFYAEDANTNLNYFIDKIKLSKYYQIDTLDSYLNQLIEDDVPATDTVLVNKKITISTHSGRYFKQASDLTHNYLHGYLMVVGNELYQIYFYGPEEVEESRIFAFLNSFQLTGEPSSINLVEKKIELIMNDFESADSLTQARASVALENHPFVESELPYLYAALDKAYPNDSIEYNSTVAILCDILKTTNDSSTVEFLVANYNQFADEPIRKSRILKTLAFINTQESIASYLDLFKDFAPQEDANYNYGLLDPFSDSLEYLITHYELIKDKNQRDTTWGSQLDGLILQLVNNDSI
ncbi:MAG: TraB/GumN family protein, partial [Bacteroidota bacterium]